MRAILKATSSIIHVFGLVAFAWSLPTFIALSESEEFFISYRIDRWQVVIFAVFCGLIVPAALGLLVEGLRRLNARLDPSLLGGSIAFLVALALMPNLKRLPGIPGIIIFILCIFIGVRVMRWYFRFPALRDGFTMLAVVAPAYTLWFILSSSIVFPPENEDRPYQLSQSVESRPTIVLVIFDQFSLQAILDENKGINGEAFPNFARLAEHSNWFRNASAVAEMTIHAVPAILTGRYSEGGFWTKAAPSLNNYPNNAFTLFNALGYDVYASEAASRLCPHPINHIAKAEPSLWREARMFISDILIVNGHIYLKNDITQFIPTMEGLVSNFALHPLPMANDADAPSRKNLDSISAQNRDFLMNLENRKARFYMLHLITPHHPYRSLRSGKRYMNYSGALRDNYIKYYENWPADPRHAARDMQRYFHQVAFADALLGDLLDRLEETGLYDDALIAVTSDHGVSFRPEYGMRLAIRKGESRVADFNNAMDIIKVPAFIKLPHQREAKIIDSPFQSIDILPTLVGVIAGSIAPGYFDGRALLSPDPAELVTQRLFSRNNNAFVKHNLDTMAESYDVSSKFSILDFDNHFALRGRYYEDFTQEPLSIPLAADPANFSATLINARKYEDVDLLSNFVPAFVRARVNSGEVPSAATPILITVNGKFGAVAQTFSINSETWISAVVDEGLLRSGRNVIAMYEIVEDQMNEPLCKQVHLIT